MRLKGNKFWKITKQCIFIVIAPAFNYLNNHLHNATCEIVKF